MSEQAIQTEQPKETRGRPSVYGPIVVGKILGAFQLGLSVKTVCGYAGINPDTLYDWMNKYPDFSEKVTTARSYATLLAAQTIQDVLQDMTRGKVNPKTGKLEHQKYSEQTRVGTAKWYLERMERESFGSQSVTATKVESDGKGGVTTTIIHGTDNQFTQLVEDERFRSRIEEVHPGQFLEVLENSGSEEDMARGADQGRPAPVHSEELQSEHTANSSLPQS